MAHSWIRQTSSSWEDLEALASAAPSSSTPMPAAAGNAARVEDLGLGTCEQDPAAEEDAWEAGESPTDAYSLWFGSDAPESDPEGLAEAWGQDVADLWYGELRDFAWQRLGTWKRTSVGLVTVAGNVAEAGQAVVAIDALLATSRADTADTVLRRFVAVLDGLLAFMPYEPGLSEFLATLSALMEGVCEQVEGFVALIRRREGAYDEVEDMGVYNPNAYPGGEVMYDYLFQVGRGGPAAPVPAAVIDFTMDQRGMLGLATGEPPPAQREEQWGLDLLAQDQVDPVALAGWYERHVRAIQRALYGDRAPGRPTAS